MKKCSESKLSMFFLIVTLSTISLAEKRNYDYPETPSQRKIEEMDSILGGDGLIFRPGKIKNTSTVTADSKINKYLWRAAMDILKFIPISSSDSNAGVIITEWHVPQGKENFRFKLNVIITENVISPEAIEVRVFEQKLVKSTWVDTLDTPDLALKIEDKILRRARELFIDSESKK